MTYPIPTFRPGNSFELIKEIPDNSIQLTVSSPPYNIGKEYEPRVSLEAYLAPYRELITDLFAKTRETGSVAWQVGSHVDHGEIFPLDIWFYQLFKDAGFQLRNRIVWHYEHGLHASLRLSGRYETILWFTKSEDYLFNLDPIRVPSKYPGKLHFKGAKKGLPSGNPLGKNPTDAWENVLTEDWEWAWWNIPNVKSNHPEKTEHPCQFPVELVQRCVLALSEPGDLVFDPFLGVASTAIGALMHERPLGKPIYQPTGREKTAQRPETWSKNL
jgi:adenine-specific DNA-methyltransferase